MRGLRRSVPLLCLIVIFAAALLYVASLDEQYLASENLQRLKDNDFVQKVRNPRGWNWADQRPSYRLRDQKKATKIQVKQIPAIQARFESISDARKSEQNDRRKQVKEVFERGWNATKKQAWQADEVAPISGSGRNYTGGWASTLIDSMDTLWLMGMDKDFVDVIDLVEGMDFSKPTVDDIDVYGHTTRHLAALLSTFDLVRKPFLFLKAVQVGEILLKAFNTPEGFPVPSLNLTLVKVDNKQQPLPNTLFADQMLGLTLEFTRLSQLTGQPKWYDAVARVNKEAQKQQMQSGVSGLLPVTMPSKPGNAAGTVYKLVGSANSIYDYLPKTFAVLGGLEDLFKDMFLQAMAAATERLLTRPMTPKNDEILVFGDVSVKDDNTTDFHPTFELAACSAGSSLAMAGRMFEKENYVKVAQKVVDGCIWISRAMPWSIMPQLGHVVPCESRTECTWDRGKWLNAVKEGPGKTDPHKDKNVEQIIADLNLPEGITCVNDGRYQLRPEVIESIFVMYRVTGDKKYQDAAWDLFQAIKKTTEVPFGNAALKDVMSKDKPQQEDKTEAHWLATLKYFYLIFSEPTLINLDEWVLNVHAHPFKRPVPKGNGGR